MDAVYAVLADKTIVQANGVFDKTTIDGIWQQKGYSFEEKAKLLQLMLKDNFELCYQLPQNQESAQNRVRYRVPSLLSPKQPDYHWDNNNNLQFRFQYPFMPKGIVSRLIVRMHQTAMQDRLWQEGAVFSRAFGKQRVLAQVTEQLTPEGLKVIALRLTGPASQRKECLTLLREEIKIIQSSSFPSLPFDEMVPCCCNECSSAKDSAKNSAQTPYFFKHQVLETFMHKGKTSIPCQSSAEDVAIAELVGNVFELKEIEARIKSMNDERVNIHFAPVLTQNNEQKQQADVSQNASLTATQQQTVSQQVKQVHGLFKNLQADIDNELDIEIDDEKEKKRIQYELQKTTKALAELEQATADGREPDSANKSRLDEFVDNLGNKDSRLNKALNLLSDGKNKIQRLAKVYNKFAPNFGLTLVPPVLLGESKPSATMTRLGGHGGRSLNQ